MAGAARERKGPGKEEREGVCSNGAGGVRQVSGTQGDPPFANRERPVAARVVSLAGWPEE